MRKLLLAIGLVASLLSTQARAADSTLAALTAASAIAGPDLFYCTQSGADRKCTATQAGAFVYGLMSGDASASGTGVVTFPSVNANVGSFGSTTSCVTLTVNAKGLVTAASAATCAPAVGSVTGLGTGVATALGVNIGTAGSFVTNGGALGTPSSGTATNLTGLPIAGITGLGTGVGTALGNALNGAAGLVGFSGALGTPTSGVATNLTGTAAGLTAGNVTTNANLTGDVTSVGNATTYAGIVPAAKGGAGTITGALKANGSGTVSQAACADLSNATVLCSTTPGTGVATAVATNLSAAGGLTSTIASGTAALGTSAVSSGACATVVTVAATNVATTDVVTASFNADPTGVVGYQPATTGMLTIIGYPTAGNVNFKVCNNTNASITPGAITLNFRVVR